ncbi:MAG: hypothetical protein HC925_01705 [Coleofasciculaceae cyanobacterium SM2_3_26]|nr:hypothetical protein [Coleofasciculaceae cyanobacterium SM2_3_26]
MRSHIEASFLSTVRRPTGALPCIPQGRTIPLTLAALVIASASVAPVYPAQAQTLDGAFHAQPSSDRTLQKKTAPPYHYGSWDGDPRSVETPSATSLSNLSDTPGVQTSR